ncbi:uncharacterized protein CDAR_181361, partial [Caerostris darwini]
SLHDQNHSQEDQTK